MKIKKKNGGGPGGRVGGQDVCERRIEVFVKIHKRIGGGGGGGVGLGGVRVVVIEDLKFLGKFTKKIGGGGSEDRVGVGGQGGCE